MGRLIRAAVAVLVLYALWQTGSVYWQYLQLQNRVDQIAQANVGHDEQEIRAAVVEAASNLGVTLDPERIGLRLGDNSLAIDAVYETAIRPVPGWSTPWTFRIEARAWLIPAGGIRNRGGVTLLRRSPTATASSPA